jgi:hypothetical protein
MRKALPKQHSARHGYDGEPPELREPRNRTAWKHADEIPRQNCRVDRLEWLLAHKRILQDQFDAGRRLQSDWEIAQLRAFASLDLSNCGVTGAGQNRVSDTKLDAMERYGAAIKMLGSSGGTIVRLVVLENISLEKAASLMRIHSRGALPALQVALDTLSAHYGYSYQ